MARPIRKKPSEKGRQLERAYLQLHGLRKSYPEIAVGLYDLSDSCFKVAEQIGRLYGVEVSYRTVSRWINEGEAARKGTTPQELLTA